MFGKKTSTLKRSPSFGQRLTASRGSPQQSSVSSSSSSPHRLRAQSVDVSGIVVIDDDSDENAAVSSTEFALLRTRLNHLERTLETVSDPNGERFATLFADLEKLKSEATRLAIKLEENLAMLQKQRSLMDGLLESKPDETVFPSSNVKIRVGEHVFHTSLSTLRKDPTSMLAAMFSGKFSLVTDAEGCHFIDRDGALFHHILTFLRSGKITKDLSDREREDLIEECVFYGLEKLSEVLKSQSGKAVTSREDDLYEKNTMLNIQSIATSNYVQSVIASLAEVTHLAFRQMAADAEQGNAETILSFSAGQPFHDFFVGADGHPKQTLHIFLELLRQEGAPCVLVPSSAPNVIVVKCALLRSDKEICAEVLRNFKKMRGFSLAARGH